MGGAGPPPFASAFGDTDGDFFAQIFWGRGWGAGGDGRTGGVFRPPHCFRLRRYGRRNFRPKQNLDRKKFSQTKNQPKFVSAKNFSAEIFSAEKLFGRNFFQPKNSPSVSPKAEATRGVRGGRRPPPGPSEKQVDFNSSPVTLR